MTCGGGDDDDDDDDGVGGGAEGDGAGSTSRSPKNPPPLAPRRWVGRGGARVEGGGSARPLPAPRRGVGRNHAGCASARMDAGLLDAAAATAAAASGGAEGRFPPLGCDTAVQIVAPKPAADG